ncbi:MAG: MarR family transcriptional regulator [Rhodoferax sp.]|nr:MarR family transcriptional regulator [Rhodoferax sp.]
MSRSLKRFEARVLKLMSHDETVPLALSNLAARGQLTAAHVQITRHLPLRGARLTDLAKRAGVSKQAMGKLVDQCEAWGLVHRSPDRLDARAQTIEFTATGQAWLGAFERAVTQAEDEMRQGIGLEVVTVITLGLEAYVA